MHYNVGVESNLARRLQAAISAADWRLLERIAQTAVRLDLPLYVVGGLPRDTILGVPSGDFDLVVEGDAARLAERLAKKYGGTITVHSRFGTAKWHFDHPDGLRRSVDVITARSETYKHPAALPTVKPGTIADDLMRRDFTINALAIRLDGVHLGELRDDAGGLADLEHGRVRVLHDGSFIDDPTRMYRAVRYEQRYGFAIDEGTLALIAGARGLIGKLSAQRVRHELDLILAEERTVAMLRRLAELDLLHPMDEHLGFDDADAQRMEAVSEAMVGGPRPVRAEHIRWLLWLMAQPEEALERINSRLHFPGNHYSELMAASALWHELPALPGQGAVAWVERLDSLPGASVRAVALAADPGPAKDSLERYLREWHALKPHTTGDELKELGVKPGPAYRSILQELRRAWLEGRVQDRHEERKLLLELVERVKAG